MSMAWAPNAVANRPFCSTSATLSNVISTPSPVPASVRLASPTSMTWRGTNVCPTSSAGSSAPANPAEITSDGWYRLIAASVARRAASAPTPPQTTTFPSRSKNLNLYPSYSRTVEGQSFTNGDISRSRAAMIATLPELVIPDPAHAYPFVRNHSTALRNASVTKPGCQPNSRSAFSEETNIFLRLMRTASTVARGSLRKMCPVTTWSYTHAASTTS